MKILIDFLALLILYIFAFYKKWKQKGNDILLINTLMYIYISFILFYTLMPIIVSLPFIFNHQYIPMNLIPFSDVINGYGDFIRQIILNIIMMIPFGFLFPLTQNKKHKFLKTVLYTFTISLSIELLQPLISGLRSSDITDIITNTLGGIIGYLFYLILNPPTIKILNYIKNK